MKTVIVCAVSLLFAGLASAQEAPAAPKAEKPKLSTGACKDEVQKFCKDAEKGKIGDCLKQHEADLSDGCKAGMKDRAERKHKEAREKVKDACKGDVEKLCKDSEKGKVGECLKQHKDELSDDCKAAREKMHEKKHEGKHEKKADKADEPKPEQK